MTIVELKKPFASDAKFIESLKDNYLGTINAKVTKAQLVELVHLQSKHHYNEYLQGCLQPRFPDLKESFTKAGLDDKNSSSKYSQSLTANRLVFLTFAVSASTVIFTRL